MGRPKGYDREQVLEAAMDLFWRQGFEATSTQQLVEHLGINRNSMYSEFGSKQEFFEATLSHYEQKHFAPNFEPLMTTTAGLEEIGAVFDRYGINARGKNSGLGCLLCNTAVALAPVDPAIQQISNRFIKRATKGFTNALTNARDAGFVSAAINIREEAQFLTATWLGVLVLLRAKTPSSTLAAAARATKAHLASLAAGTVSA